MRAYSLDLRERIVTAVEQGNSLRTVAQRFAVSAATVSRYVHRKHHQTLPPKPQPGAKPRLTPTVIQALLQNVEQQPDQTITELHHWLQQEHPDVPISRATVHRALRKAGFTHKKSHWLLPSETKKSALPGEKQ